MAIVKNVHSFAVVVLKAMDPVIKLVLEDGYSLELVFFS